MAIVVEHEKRRYEILEKALDIFIEEGYEDATFQKIADRCGITRTTLYLYFKNKREIFTWSIKQLTDGLEKHLRLMMETDTLSYSER
ncbi:MAG TPA: helix-turn-helix domain-containing protein, partial [Treponemataceae bacterium]|nr:helix-turn-helix domain-containing protein [Treponemataceae bacterium]